MARAAWDVVKFVLAARESVRVRVAAGPSHAMTSDAELLAGAAVATRARDRIDARLHAVLTAAGARGDPPRRVGTPGCGTGGNPLRGVTIDTRRLAVARHTKAGIGARFLGMPRAKASAVKAREARLVEGK